MYRTYRRSLRLALVGAGFILAAAGVVALLTTAGANASRVQGSTVTSTISFRRGYLAPPPTNTSPGISADEALQDALSHNVLGATGKYSGASEQFGLFTDTALVADNGGAGGSPAISSQPAWVVTLSGDCADPTAWSQLEPASPAPPLSCFTYEVVLDANGNYIEGFAN